MSIGLDGETADRIAALTLDEHRRIMLEQLDNENLPKPQNPICD